MRAVTRGRPPRTRFPLCEGHNEENPLPLRLPVSPLLAPSLPFVPPLSFLHLSMHGLQALLIQVETDVTWVKRTRVLFFSVSWLGWVGGWLLGVCGCLGVVVAVRWVAGCWVACLGSGFPCSD